jgi:pimeloyl-ACP methyl ester carboxylesterase
MDNDLTEIIRIVFPEAKRTNDEYETLTDKQLDAKHIVILIHGIRTEAPWFEKVRILLKQRSSVDARNVGYGYFDVFRFVIPVFRDKPVSAALGQIQSLRDYYPEAKLSIVAHSFGTYIFSEVLKRSSIKFHRVILCGAIVHRDFTWQDYTDRIAVDAKEAKILNECGTKDIWPIFANFITYGFGASGTLGFRNSYVRDRFHETEHGDYFTKEFIQQYWIPYLLDDNDIPSNLDIERNSPPNWQSILAAIQLWQIIVVFILIYFAGNTFF